MKYGPIYLLILICFFSACSNPVFKKGPDGIWYKIIDDKNTPDIGKVAFVSLTYTESTSSGKVIATSGKFDIRPTHLFATMPEFKGDFQSALPYLSEGDSAVVKIKADSLDFRKGELANDTSKYMVYTISIKKVINRQGEVDPTYLEKIEEFTKKEVEQQQASEESKISHYLKAHQLQYKRTATGIAYPANLHLTDNSGKKLYVNYTIRSLDGKVYDTNNEQLAKAAEIYRPYQVFKPYEVTGPVKFAGFNEAIKLIPPGVKVKVIIPSNQAFGPRGNNTDIPAFCPLLCEIEIAGHS
jgi:FKBP-type peptidyl-prolyl cis-trans isomerase FkpA